jgi:D-glycero-alpha-D-manno-heptose 1-phosphate guanylyltransferase
MYIKNQIGQVIILCGGYGTRLSKITNNKVHKSIIKIGQYPFIYFILNQILNLKIKKVIICTGFLSNTVEKAIYEFNKKNPNKFDFIFSHETRPLGTGGALLNTHPNLSNSYSLVINGDTFVNDNLFQFCNSNLNKDIIMLTSFKYLSKNYGTVIFDKNSEFIGFNEKKLSAFCYVYSGVSIFRNKILNQPVQNKVNNIEDLFFNNISFSKRVIKSNKRFIDIGTQKRYLKNEKFFNSLKLPFVL